MVAPQQIPAGQPVIDNIDQAMLLAAALPDSRDSRPLFDYLRCLKPLLRGRDVDTVPNARRILEMESLVTSLGTFPNAPSLRPATQGGDEDMHWGTSITATLEAMETLPSCPLTTTIKTFLTALLVQENDTIRQQSAQIAALKDELLKRMD